MKYILEYIWAPTSIDFRSKIRVLDMDECTIDNVPIWNYDGSSTGQATVENSVVNLIPCKLYSHPLIGDRAYMVYCEMYKPNGHLALGNTRHLVQEPNIQSRLTNEAYWIAFEQEFFLYQPETRLPLTFTSHLGEFPRGKNYCGNEQDYIPNTDRKIIYDHMKACMKCDIAYSGNNVEVSPGQYEYQIGHAPGIQALDDLMISRFLLLRVASTYNMSVSFCVKMPGLDDSYNGSGCHVNISNEKLRNNDDNELFKFLEEQKKKHNDMISMLGEENKARLRGSHETSDWRTFSYGKNSRVASIRINDGYIEDRRPGSDVDVYRYTYVLLHTLHV